MTHVRRKYPLDSLQSDWESIHQELDRSSEAEREATKVAAQIHAENGMLAERLDRTITELNFWRSYALSMETRLDVIGNVVSEVQNNARSRALEETKQPAPSTAVSEYAPDPNLRAILRAVSPEENDGAGDLVSRLNGNQNGH